MTALMPGAEPWTFSPPAVGALCLHGFTGHPGSMRGVAEAFARAGFAVELPRLPGHGTNIGDMLGTTFADWAAEADAAYERLAARCDRVVVAGLSMGGTLALWLASRRPDVTGLVCINPPTQPQPDEVLDMVRGMADEGEVLLPGGGSDIADPDAVDAGYEGTPLLPLLTLQAALAELEPQYASIQCPLLLVTSRHDHVVDPAQSDALAAVYGGLVERLLLEHSYHVATLDFDRDLVIERAVAFGRRVVAGA